MHRLPLPPGNTPDTQFLLEAELIPGPECDQKNFMWMKNSLTLAGIEPVAFQIVAQHLNHCATVVPRHTQDSLKCETNILHYQVYMVYGTY